ncbi:hypothetical protein GCM10023063_36470 [Arthrobacter methylotrophus]|uniref:hypothetical protein n=1 Tax=Arthrobacter methylotrophus TaxID=121291 RepID=UPI0031E5E814
MPLVGRLSGRTRAAPDVLSECVHISRLARIKVCDQGAAAQAGWRRPGGAGEWPGAGDTGRMFTIERQGGSGGMTNDGRVAAIRRESRALEGLTPATRAGLGGEGREVA